MNKRTTARMNFIRNSYAQLLLYYYKMGVGSSSEITGTTITDVLIDTIEKRYEQLGGNSVILKLRDHRHSMCNECRREYNKKRYAKQKKTLKQSKW